MVTIEVFVTAFSSLAVLVAGAFFWVMTDIRSLRKEMREEFRADRQERREDRDADRQERREDNRTLREELLAAIQTESEARRADTQRILEAIYYHRHDPDGTVALRPPTQQALTEGCSHDHAQPSQNRAS